jgi:hypothetical protein
MPDGAALAFNGVTELRNGKASTSKRKRLPEYDAMFWLLEEMGAQSFHHVLVEMAGHTRAGAGPEALPRIIATLHGLLHIGWIWVSGADSMQDAKQRLDAAASEVHWNEPQRAWRAPNGGLAETTEIVLLPKAQQEYQAT